GSTQHRRRWSPQIYELSTYPFNTRALKTTNDCSRTKGRLASDSGLVFSFCRAEKRRLLALIWGVLCVESGKYASRLERSLQADRRGGGGVSHCLSNRRGPCASRRREAAANSPDRDSAERP